MGLWNQCGVDKLVNTSAAHVCAFARLSPCAKTESVMLTHFFCGTNSHNRQAEDQPGVRVFLKDFLPTLTTLDQIPSDYTVPW